MRVFQTNVGTAILSLAYTVATTAAKTALNFGFTATQVAKANSVTITAGANPIRYLYDGTTPVTTGIGHYLAALGTVTIQGAVNVSKLQVVAVSGNSDVTMTLEQ